MSFGKKCVYLLIAASLSVGALGCGKKEEANSTPVNNYNSGQDPYGDYPFGGSVCNPNLAFSGTAYMSPNSPKSGQPLGCQVEAGDVVTLGVEAWVGDRADNSDYGCHGSWRTGFWCGSENSCSNPRRVSVYVSDGVQTYDASNGSVTIQNKGFLYWGFDANEAVNFDRYDGCKYVTQKSQFRLIRANNNQNNYPYPYNGGYPNSGYPYNGQPRPYYPYPGY